MCCEQAFAAAAAAGVDLRTPEQCQLDAPRADFSGLFLRRPSASVRLKGRWHAVLLPPSVVTCCLRQLMMFY